MKKNKKTLIGGIVALLVLLIALVVILTQRDNPEDVEYGSIDLDNPEDVQQDGDEDQGANFEGMSELERQQALKEQPFGTPIDPEDELTEEEKKERDEAFDKAYQEQYGQTYSYNVYYLNPKKNEFEQQAIETESQDFISFIEEYSSSLTDSRVIGWLDEEENIAYVDFAQGDDFYKFYENNEAMNELYPIEHDTGGPRLSRFAKEILLQGYYMSVQTNYPNYDIEFYLYGSPYPEGSVGDFQMLLPTTEPNNQQVDEDNA